MKKAIFILLIAALLSACNSAEKKAETNTPADTPQADAIEMVEVTYTVEGMTCDGCENAINKSVESLEGIAEVESSHEEGWTKVTYNPEKTGSDDIQQRIGDAGYLVVNEKQAE